MSHYHRLPVATKLQMPFSPPWKNTEMCHHEKFKGCSTIPEAFIIDQGQAILNEYFDLSPHTA